MNLKDWLRTSKCLYLVNNHISEMIVIIQPEGGLWTNILTSRELDLAYRSFGLFWYMRTFHMFAKYPFSRIFITRNLRRTNMRRCGDLRPSDTIRMLH